MTTSETIDAELDPTVAAGSDFDAGDAVDTLPAVLEQFKSLVSDFKRDVDREQLTPVEAQYKSARKHFENHAYPEAAGMAASLIREQLALIIDKNYRPLSHTDAFKKAWIEALERTKEVGVQGDASNPTNWSLADLCALYDEVDVWGFLEGAYKDSAALLRSFHWRHLAELAELCKVAQSSSDEAIALGVQQLLCAAASLMRAAHSVHISEYYLLANFQHMTEEVLRLRAHNTKLSPAGSKLSYLPTDESDISIRPFQWIKFRGMLINATDGSRNISFKVETLVSMLDTIHRGIATWCEPKSDKHGVSIHTLASNILFESGYKSGSRFGWTMHEIFQKERRRLTLEDKIQAWCEFDSDVGFGMLSLPEGGVSHKRKEKKGVSYEEYSVAIELSYNFLAYRRETSQTSLCPFISGYIQGVLEKITGQPLIVSHGADECEQYNADRDSCVFHASTDASRLVGSLLDARDRFSVSFSPALQSSDLQTRKEA